MKSLSALLRPRSEAAFLGEHSPGSAKMMTRLGNVDTFERSSGLFPGHSSNQGANHYISVILSPRLRRQERLTEAVSLIGTAPISSEKLDRAERMLASLRGDAHLGYQAELWQAISQRLRGNEVTDRFEALLRRNPTHRLALLNYGAAYIVSLEKTTQKTQEVYQKIRDHCAIHQDDSFAHLLEALLVDRHFLDSRLSINCLESLYLRDRKYTPGITTMAALLNNTGRHDAASDYAREALQVHDGNLQALFFSEPPTVNRWCEINRALSHVVYTQSFLGREAVLFLNYFLQDPLFNF